MRDSGTTQLVLGIDGGGSGTTGCLLDLSGAKVAEAGAGPSNHLRNGLFRAKTSLQEVVADLLRRGGGRAQQVVCACAGLAGVYRRSDQELLFRVVSEILPGCYWILEHDAFVALAGATDCRPGLVVVSGTGSIAFGIDGQGRRARAGGWGHILGDEGSGFDMARRGVIAALRAHDGRGPATMIQDRLKKELYLESLDSVIEKLHGPTVNVPHIASLFPLIVETAEAGDPLAQEVLREGARELALAAASVRGNLSFRDEELLVAISGGVFRNPLLRTEFERALGEHVPQARVTEPLCSPAEGAARVARRCFLGLEVFRGDQCRVSSTMPVARA